jgi:hypothetical protein
MDGKEEESQDNYMLKYEDLKPGMWLYFSGVPTYLQVIKRHINASDETEFIQLKYSRFDIENFKVATNYFISKERWSEDKLVIVSGPVKIFDRIFNDQD